MQANFRGKVSEKDTVVIIGAGTIGLCVLQVSKTKGAKVIMIDLAESKLKFAKLFGADKVINASQEDPIEEVKEYTQGEGANVVIEAVGSPKTIEQTLSLVSAAGRIVLLGLTPENITFPAVEFIKKELDFYGSRLNTYQFPEVIKFLSQSKINPEKMITHRFSLLQTKGAMEFFDKENKNVIKIILNG
jgi:L-gulonate 5-dehydrogenase